MSGPRGGNWSIPTGVCRYGSCMKGGTGKPPLCKDHKPGATRSKLPPSELEPITDAAKTAGNARVARRRV